MHKQYVSKWIETSGWAVALMIFLAIASPAGARIPLLQQKPATFATADDAIQAVVEAAEKNDTPALIRIFGRGARDIVESGDPEQDKQARSEFGIEAREKLFVNATRPDLATFTIGEQHWPFPIPLVRLNGKWQFDAEEGRGEILARRIGENELNVIEISRGFVEAELEYASLDRDHSGLLTYAQKIQSFPGRQDGLYWDDALGSLVPKALVNATVTGDSGTKGFTPYHGYFFRVLTSQGPNAEGGAYQYVVNGKMIGGFALVAWPAEYGVSGIKTFIVNHDGIVFEKDLGGKTAVSAGRLSEFDPDSSWQRVAD